MKDLSSIWDNVTHNLSSSLFFLLSSSENGAEATAFSFFGGGSGVTPIAEGRRKRELSCEGRRHNTSILSGGVRRSEWGKGLLSDVSLVTFSHVKKTPLSDVPNQMWHMPYVPAD